LELQIWQKNLNINLHKKHGFTRLHQGVLCPIQGLVPSQEAVNIGKLPKGRLTLLVKIEEMLNYFAFSNSSKNHCSNFQEWNWNLVEDGGLLLV